MSELPKYLPADERRIATVEAVVDLAAQQNPSDITTTAIAQHMGVTQGALFRHFASKDAILQAVMSWVAQRLMARVDAAADGAASPLAALCHASSLGSSNAPAKPCPSRWCRP